MTQPTEARQRRVRKTRRSVFIADRAAALIISIGGVGTIGAVSLVCLFLVYVVIPLFVPSQLTLTSSAEGKSVAGGGKSLHFGVDEYLNVVWNVTDEGTLTSYRIDNGEQVSTQQLFADKQLTAQAFELRDGHVILAFDDNTFQRGSIGFSTTFVPPDEVPDEIKDLPAGQVAGLRNGIVERTPEQQFRLQELEVKLEDPVKVKSEASISLIDQSVSSRGTIVAMLMDDGELRIARVTSTRNLLTNKVTTKLREGKVQAKLHQNKLPRWLLLAGLGDNVFMVWEDGTLMRYDTRDSNAPAYVETVDLVENEAAHLTTVEFLIGKTTLLAGDSEGNVDAWFRIKPEFTTTADGSVLAKAHRFAPLSAPITAIASSPRSRMMAAADADGNVRLYHVTSDQVVADQKLDSKAGIVDSLLISSKDDSLLVASAGGLTRYEIDAPHPEVSVSAIFGKIWYEGYEEPKHVWQSSSGTDDFEEKFGLVPLVFGTLKATFYSMMFGVPLAILAAIYTSEFLHSSAKAKIKPTIEIMASLPSVVLGFLAALFFAPLVEDIVPECLAMIATIPFTFLLGAYLWQLFPESVAVYMRRMRLIGMLLALPIGIMLAWPTGRLIERFLFAGDIMAWLDGQIGTGVGAWMFILFPATCLAVAWQSTLVITPRIRSWAGHLSRFQFGVLDLFRFLGNCLAVVVIAYVFSWLLSTIGFDPRGIYVDTYVQRNALVVGFIMGFAVIPIIYTISDDALSAVPESLRAGSLGAGATEWQTAVRVVIPTAMSGLFSAVMIGLGRAVGETMIVLMAAGNTPVMDLNIFNGFRTLSANIAVELPEAVKDSTHYRMLFLAALTLFLITFVVNTIAELVRLRFRKRAFQL